MNYQTIITPATLADNLYTSNWLTLDCRGALLSDNKGYKNYTNSHIPNSYYYCSLGYSCDDTSTQDGCNDLPSESNQILERLEELGFDESTQIIIYEDLNSSFTDSMWLKLRSLGLKNVAVLQGGFTFWREHNLPTTIDSEYIENEQLCEAV